MYTQNVDKSKIECYNCKHKGHITSDCQQLGGGAANASNGNNGGNRNGGLKRGKGKGKDTLNIAMASGGVFMSCMATGDDSPSSVWLIDSGSLAHTAVNHQDFVTYTATPGNAVRGIGSETSTLWTHIFELNWWVAAITSKTKGKCWVIFAFNLQR